MCIRDRTYTALQAGPRPWRFTFFISVVVAFATLLGFILISWQAPFGERQGLYAAAAASTLSAAFALALSIHLSGSWNFFFKRSNEWFFAVLCMSVACYGLSTKSWLSGAGVLLFLFIPQALQAVGSNVEQKPLLKNSEAE